MSDEVRPSYPTPKMILELLSYLFYESDGGLHYGWKDHIPVSVLLEKHHPELLSTWKDIWNYQSSPTRTIEE